MLEEVVDAFIYYLVDVETFEVVGTCLGEDDVENFLYAEDSGEIVESIPFSEYMSRK